MQIQTVSKKTAYLCAGIVIASVILLITGRNTAGNVFLYQFSHGNVFHLVANIIPFYLFLKSALDRKTWIVFVFAGYLISVFVAGILPSGNVIGLSGWVFAMYGMYLSFKFKRITNKRIYTAGNIIPVVVSLAIGFVIPNVSGGIHLVSWVVGLISGYLVILINSGLMVKKNLNKTNRSNI